MDKDTQHMLLETVSMLLEKYLHTTDYWDKEYGNHWHIVLGKLQHAMQTVYDEEEK